MGSWSLYLNFTLAGNSTIRTNCPATFSRPTPSGIGYRQPQVQESVPGVLVLQCLLVTVLIVLSFIFLVPKIPPMLASGGQSTSGCANMKNTETETPDIGLGK